MFLEAGQGKKVWKSGALASPRANAQPILGTCPLRHRKARCREEVAAGSIEMQRGKRRAAFSVGITFEGGR